MDLRYGVNPHQRARVVPGPAQPARLVHGAPSYLNLLDALTAWPRRLDGVTLVSDGFIPFRDNIDDASRYGVRQVIEPGGSARAAEVAAACDELGISLVHTGIRLFRH